MPALSYSVEARQAVGNKFVEGVKVGALWTVNKGLEKAKLNPNQFWNVIDHLGDVAKPLITRGKKLVGNFLSAVNEGFRSFFSNIGKHVLGVANVQRVRAARWRLS